MAKVTVEGSRVRPTTYLAPGKRMTVDDGPMVRKMIRRGYVTVVHREPVVEEITRTVEAQRTATDSERRLSGAPARNASRDEWAAFIEDRGYWVDPAYTRNQLIDFWDARKVRPSEEAPEEAPELVDVKVVDDGGTTD